MFAQFKYWHYQNTFVEYMNSFIIHFISFSYKEEDSENQTDSDDLLEITAPTTAADEEDENRETIEKVIMHRQGRKGGKYLILTTVKNKIAALA